MHAHPHTREEGYIIVKHQFKPFHPDHCHPERSEGSQYIIVKHQFRPFHPVHGDDPVYDLLIDKTSVTEEDTAPLAAFHGSLPAVPHKEEGRSFAPLRMTAVLRLMSTGLARLQDPQP